MTAKDRPKIKRPTSVKIMTLTYNIVWLSEDEWYSQHLDDGAIGLTNKDNAEIQMRVSPVTNEDALRVTLLHEMLHACTESNRLSRHLGDVNEPEEFFVAMVAPILHLVMVDNPSVVAYLLSVA